MIPIVADECVDDPIIDRLRADGYTVWSIGENIPSTPDLGVLREATIRHSLLLTEDKDFGDLVMRDRRPAPYGIVLYRLPVMPSSIKQHWLLRRLPAMMQPFQGCSRLSMRPRRASAPCRNWTLRLLSP